MILYRDAEDSPFGHTNPTVIEIVKQEGPKVWYRIIDGTNSQCEVFDCHENALDSKFYEISKAELVKRVLKNG